MSYSPESPRRRRDGKYDLGRRRAARQPDREFAFGQNLYPKSFQKPSQKSSGAGNGDWPNGRLHPILYLLCLLLSGLSAASRAQTPAAAVKTPVNETPAAPASEAPSPTKPPSEKPPAAAGGEGSDSASAFETYVLARPAQTGGASQSAGPVSSPGSFSSGSSGSFSPERERSGADNLAMLASLTLFPGSSDVSLTAGGRFGGQTIEAQLSPAQWGQGHFGGSYFQVGQGPGGLRLGGIGALPAGGTLQGARLSAPWKTGQATFGLGLYQQIGGEGRSLRLVPAIDAQWQTGRERQGSAILATDASWQISQQFRLVGGQMLAVAGRDAHSGQGQISLGFERNLRRYTVLNLRAGVQDGEGRGGLGALGLTQRIGAGYGVLDASLSETRGERLMQTALGLFVPLRRQTLGLRWQRIQIGTASSAVRAQTTDLLTGTWSAALSPQTNAWVAGYGALRRQARFEGSVAAGFSRDLNARWSVQSEINQALGRDTRRIRLSVGCQVMPDWNLRLLCGPSLRGGASAQAFGLQIAHRFRVTRPREGRVQGQVWLDGKPCAQGVQVQIDEGGFATTDAQGRFQFRHVPAGSHAVHLELAGLPAWIDAETPSLPAHVAQGKTCAVEFALRSVAQAQGSVRVLADVFGQTDPTAAVGIVIEADADAEAGDVKDSAGPSDAANTGHGAKSRRTSASTNAENHFTLGGLEPGRHTVVLDARTLPPDYEIIGPARIEIVVSRDKPCSPLEFTIAPRARKIEYASGL